MPTQEYRCLTHGAFDLHLGWDESPSAPRQCPLCGKSSVWILRAPAGGAHFARTWNEKANDMRRDPYTQAKAQIDQVYSEQKDQGKHPAKITEEGIQAAAREIDKDNKGLRPKRDPVREQHKALKASKVRAKAV